jgi:methylenetetrahydrofolate dehydrogenase (NADP+)/methenyltetrahydrofolate cyclohydrolase
MVVSTIAPAKDVDGLTPASLGRITMGEELYTPAAAGAVIEILNQSNITIHSKKILIGGTSKILALPLANMLINRGGIVTVAPSPNDSFVNYSKVSDIVIVDFGIPKLVKGRMVARGSVIIDSGNNYVDGKVVGDVDIDDVIQKVSMVTPVPGGLGPMLIAVLLKSIVKAANLRSSEHS